MTIVEYFESDKATPEEKENWIDFKTNLGKYIDRAKKIDERKRIKRKTKQLRMTM